MEPVAHPSAPGIAGDQRRLPPVTMLLATSSILTLVKRRVAGDVALAHQSVTAWVNWPGRFSHFVLFFNSIITATLKIYRKIILTQKNKNKTSKFL
jgi:hypothetical protein